MTPLQQVESAVQQQARAAGLDLDEPGAGDELRRLIEHAIESWHEAYRQGEHRADLHDPATIADRAYRNLAGYGPLQPLLDDDDVWEIMVNGPDEIFVRRHSCGPGYHPECFHDDDHVTRTITRILEDAATSNRSLDPSTGLQDAQLADGSRMHIVHGDVSRGGHLMVNIRKFTGVPFRSLDELVERDMLSPAAARFLAACARARLSVVFAGPPGSGKTTLLSCTLAELDPALRVVVAEEVSEVTVPVANVAAMQTRAARPERPGIGLRDLVAGFLRMAPDVAVVGEVRDRAALPYLLTLSSGVCGYTTIHAASAHRALTRLRFVSQLADTHDLPLTALNHLVADSIDVVVQCDRRASGPRVTEIAAVEDLAGGPDATRFTMTDLFGRSEPDAPLAPTGEVPVRAADRAARSGVDLHAVLRVPA